jgi:hypothetical protein
MTEMKKFYKIILGIIAETDSEETEKAVRIFLEFHSYLVENSSAYRKVDFGVNFGEIVYVLETDDT